MINIQFILLDASRICEEIDEARKMNVHNLSLFKNKEQEHIQAIAPYFFYNLNVGFLSWVETKGWGNSWGIYIISDENFITIFEHVCQLSIVKTEDGEQLYFRFYDPRVLRIFLPTCDAQQLIQFFGPVQQFICEDEDPAYALIFSFDGKKLLTERVEAVSIFPALKNDTQIPSLSNQIVQDSADVITVELNSHHAPRKFLE